MSVKFCKKASPEVACSSPELWKLSLRRLGPTLEKNVFDAGLQERLQDVGCVEFSDAPLPLLLGNGALKSATHPTVLSDCPQGHFFGAQSPKKPRFLPSKCFTEPAQQFLKGPVNGLGETVSSRRKVV